MEYLISLLASILMAPVTIGRYLYHTSMGLPRQTEQVDQGRSRGVGSVNQRGSRPTEPVKQDRSRQVKPVNKEGGDPPPCITVLSTRTKSNNLLL